MTGANTTIAKYGWWAASALRWLTGPIFDKEMRVSSRRRRNYVLRFVYVGLFTFLVAVLWVDRVAHTAISGTASVYQVSRMASAGQQIIMSVLWFQFLTSQIIAIVMLSTSISDEIYKRTLGTLMTTPIGSFQIVIGKLASKLLQIVLLLAISLPLLAVVRVFGGVPWGFLLCGLCVTLTTVMFVGSLSLFFSIFTRRAYTAIMETIVTCGALFAGIPLILALLFFRARGPSPSFVARLSYFNPFMTMGAATDALAMARTRLPAWPVHCAIMLGFSTLLLLLAMIFVRRAALRQALGQVGNEGWGSLPSPESSFIRRVVGPPVLWKERRIPLLGRRKAIQIAAAFLILGALVLTYWLCVKERAIRQPEVHMAYAITFLSAGLLFTMVLPATCITTERESRTWPLLLTTTVGTWEILWSKFVGVLRRCLPAWVLLFAHVAIFVVLGIIHPLAFIQLGMLVAWLLLFLASTGLYFSTRLRHTTTAVIANMALAASLWAVIPLFLALILDIARVDTDVMKAYMDMNPYVQAVVIVDAAVHRGGVGTYNWIQRGISTPRAATGWIAMTFIVYLSVGLAFLARAAARLRRNPL